MRLGRLGALLAAPWMVAAALAAEPAAETASRPESSELLSLTVRFETIGDSELFGTELDWVHRRPDGVVTLGASSSRIDDTRWTYVKVGGARKLAGKVLASAAVDLGEGERAGSSYDYRKVRARITHLPMAGKLQLFAEAQSYAVDRFHGTLASLGASYRFEPSLAVGLGYSETIAGNSTSRIVFGRVDLERPVGVFAGFAHGTTAPDPLQLALGLGPESDYFEVYAGVSVPVRSQQLLVLLDLAEHGSTRRRAIVASWRVRWSAPKRGATG